MSDKSDYFFLNVKQVFPNFAKPSPLETEIWAELLEPYQNEEILEAIKSFRKCEETNFPPIPAKFKNYLFKRKTKSDKPVLPLSPETYLMEEDIKAGRCRHFFPTYVKAVAYVLEVKLKALFDEDDFKTFSRGRKYRLAVEYGLFADFDKTLDLVYRENLKNHEKIMGDDKHGN